MELISFTFNYTRAEIKQGVPLNPWADHEPFDMVMGHAGRTGGLRALSITHSEIKRDGSVAASIKRHGHHASLEALELVRCFPVELRVISGFGMLTDLELRGCGSMMIISDDDDHNNDDPFANIPRLRCLKLLDCGFSSWGRFKVTGLQLLKLEIRSSRIGQVSQVWAPKLESFCFTVSISERVVELPELELPSLERAAVRVVSYPGSDLGDELGWRRVAMDLLHGLRNAKSLDLYFEDKHFIKGGGSLFTRMKSMIENEFARLTRLRNWSVQCYPCD